jgi:DNA-binding LacI/PurR family transcriptional regulator
MQSDEKGGELTTINDVARYANVSPTTVSHVLNGRGRVSAQTRDRVLQVAADLGYAASAHAQQLVTRRSRIVAVQMPELNSGGTGPALVPNSEYFLELINGAAAAADKARYAMIILPAGVNVSSMRTFSIDGAIIVDPKGSEEFLQSSLAARCPVVTTGEPIFGAGEFEFVVDNDHRAATRDALDHFREQGFTQPAIVLDSTSRSYIRDIGEAYNQWCIGHSIRPTVVTLPDASPTRVQKALKALRSGAVPADAVYASSEEFAIALLEAAKEFHLRVPEDIALASAVDSSILRLTDPPISGMHLHPREIGATAVSTLMKLIDYKLGDDSQAAPEPTRELIPTRLIVRSSTTQPAAQRYATTAT